MPPTSNLCVAPALTAGDPDLPSREADQSIDPVVAECLDLVGAVTAQFAHYLHFLSQLATTATDETETVAITLNPNGRIENVWMQPGCKRLGTSIINQRLNEALIKATIIFENAKADIDDDYSRKLAVLQARNDRLKAGPVTLVPVTLPPSRDARSSTEAPTITVTAAALHECTEAELAAKIVAAARFSHNQAVDRLLKATPGVQAALI